MIDHLDWLRRVQRQGGDIFIGENGLGVAVPVPLPEAFPNLLLELARHPEWEEALDALAVGRGATEKHLYDRMFQAADQADEALRKAGEDNG
ncbi:MAG: hypothetical protein ACJ8ER_16455 [Allosphingosinicella sp.]